MNLFCVSCCSRSYSSSIFIAQPGRRFLLSRLVRSRRQDWALGLYHSPELGTVGVVGRVHDGLETALDYQADPSMFAGVMQPYCCKSLVVTRLTSLAICAELSTRASKVGSLVGALGAIPRCLSSSASIASMVGKVPVLVVVNRPNRRTASRKSCRRLSMNVSLLIVTHANVWMSFLARNCNLWIVSWPSSVFRSCMSITFALIADREEKMLWPYSASAVADGQRVVFVQLLRCP